MPNGVPQSPMWFCRMTVWPRCSSTRARASPTTVRAEVTDVHLLGDVGRGVVDDDGLRLHQRDAVARVSRNATHLLADPLVAEHEIDEARPADLDLRAHVVEVEVLEDPLCDVTGRQAHPLGQRQRHVDLEVAELAGSQHRVNAAEVLAEGPGDRVGDPGGEYG